MWQDDNGEAARRGKKTSIFSICAVQKKRMKGSGSGEEKIKMSKIRETGERKLCDSSGKITPVGRVWGG